MTGLLARLGDKALDLLADLIHRYAFHDPDPWATIRLDLDDEEVL